MVDFAGDLKFAGYTHCKHCGGDDSCGFYASGLLHLGPCTYVSTFDWPCEAGTKKMYWHGNQLIPESDYR